MTEPLHVTSEAYSELARNVLALARRDDAPEIADRLARYARVIAADEDRPMFELDVHIAELLSLAGLAVTELRAALADARVRALLAEAAEECAVLLPSDFDDPGDTPTGDGNSGG